MQAEFSFELNSKADRLFKSQSSTRAAALEFYFYLQF